MKLKKNICEDCCKGKRISELDEKVDIQGTEYIPFQEGNDNGKFSLGSLKDYLFKLIEEYLINNGIIREDWVQSEPAYKLLATLPELIADRAYKDEFGNNINDTYLTREAVKEYIGTIYEDLFVNNPPQILDGFITVDMLSDAVLQLLNSGGAITNFPDDEDITVKDGKLKFKDKVYDPNNYSGMGRTILRKNMVDGVNVLTQEMMSEPNVIYVIQYDYDLRGETIIVPDNSILWYLGGSLNNGHITSDDEDRLIIWGNLNGDIEIDIDVSLVGAPADEEDITTESGVLKFKDKEYDTASFSGLGRKYLRKNIVKGKNILTQDMISSNNTIYIIQYDYDLNGQEITIPENCVLQFEGGSLSNGTLIGTISDIKSKSKTILFSNIVIKGTWKVENIFSNWFDFKHDYNVNDNQNFDNLIALTSEDYQGVIYISEGDYYIEPNLNKNWKGHVITPNSNTIIYLNGHIIIKPTSLTNYSIVVLRNVHNVFIKGYGTITGDIETHTGASGEWGYGLEFDAAINCGVEGITIEKCWGDGIYLGAHEDNYVSYISRNIIINNVILDSNRRQGISICSVDGLVLSNSKIINTGTIEVISPGANIDIEKDLGDRAYLGNINICNCLITGASNSWANADIIIAANVDSYFKFDNCIIGTINQSFDVTGDYYFTNCEINSIIDVNKTSTGIYIDRCTLPSANWMLVDSYQKTRKEINTFYKNGGGKWEHENISIYYDGTNDMQLTIPVSIGIIRVTVIGGSYDTNLRRRLYTYTFDIGSERDSYLELVGVYNNTSISVDTRDINSDIYCSGYKLSDDKSELIITFSRYNSAQGSFHVQFNIESLSASFNSHRSIKGNCKVKTLDTNSSILKLPYSNTVLSDTYANLNSKVIPKEGNTALISGIPVIGNGKDWTSYNGDSLGLDQKEIKSLYINSDTDAKFKIKINSAGITGNITMYFVGKWYEINRRESIIFHFYIGNDYIKLKSVEIPNGINIPRILERSDYCLQYIEGTKDSTGLTFTFGDYMNVGVKGTMIIEAICSQQPTSFPILGDKVSVEFIGQNTSFYKQPYVGNITFSEFYILNLYCEPLLGAIAKQNTDDNKIYVGNGKNWICYNTYTNSLNPDGTSIGKVVFV